jgi:hypothetical protein
MRTLLVACVLAILSVCPCAYAATPPSPDFAGLQLVTQLPRELPQRIKGFSYDGQKIWATIYLGRGQYATLDPVTLEWKVSREAKEHRAIAEASGAFGSPGAVCFVNGKLWIAGAYGGSFGSIDMRDWKVEQVFPRWQRADRASQAYSSMAFDGTHVWIAWHWFRYDIPASETQRLLKIDPDTGNVVAEYPLPAGTRPDGTHGLTWDGLRLWHAKDNRLSAIDPATGVVIAQYNLGSEIKRPSGLAWDGKALWIAQFDGAIWRLPFFTF